MTVSTTNLQAYWNFDEASGDLIDQVNSNDGTVNNMTYGSTGIINDGYTFNGSTSNVTGFTESNFECSGNFTFNVWIKTSTTAGQRIAAKDTGTTREYIFYINGSGYPEMTLWRSNVGYTATGSTDVTDGDWHMISYVNDGSDLKIYVDGSLDSGSTGTGKGGSVDTGNDDFVLGYRVATGTEDFNGVMDEAAFWIGSYKTSSEITELYNSGSGLAYPFTSNTTVNPSTLTLSTSEESPSYFIDITAGAQSLTSSSLSPAIIGIPRTYNASTLTASLTLNNPSIIIPISTTVYPNTLTISTSILNIQAWELEKWTYGQRGILRNWPIVSGIDAEDKHEGRQTNLVYSKGSTVLRREKKGL